MHRGTLANGGACGASLSRLHHIVPQTFQPLPVVEACVTLARTVYSSAQILILDDVSVSCSIFVALVIDIILSKVLAALDVHTAH